MVCTYWYDIEAEQPNILPEEIREAMNNPIQVHYATGIKPWNTPGCTKSSWWFEYLLKTPFFDECMKNLGSGNRRKEKYCLLNIPIIIVTLVNNTIENMRLLGIKLKKREKRK